MLRTKTFALSLAVAALAPACAMVRPSKPVPAPAPAVAGPPPARVEKVREPLEVTPLELHFSGTRGSGKASESVAVKNTGSEAAQVAEIRVVGPNAGTFTVTSLPFLPAILQPGRSLSFAVVFAPPTDAQPGVHHARVRIIRDEDDDGPPCDLTALVTRSQAVSDEPTLQQVLESLGYDVDVGSKALRLPVEPSPLGDETKSPLFQRAKPGNVGYYLVARYAGDQAAASFGYYLAQDKSLAAKPVGGVGKGHGQSLNPELDGESQTSFDPGQAAFGLYLKVGKRVLYADDTLNPRPRQHVARSFPLRSRGRTLVQDAFVVAFDEDGDGDFQDEVFMLWNVKPAAVGEGVVDPARHPAER